MLAPVRRAWAITWSIAADSAAGGREARNPAYADPAARSSSIRRAVLGVHQHQRAQPGDLVHGGRELLLGDVRELVDPRVDQEALEAEHPGLVQRGEVGQVARDGAAPEADVDRDLVARHVLLDPQRVQRGRRRDRVQRHVDDRRDASGRSRPGGGRESLPLGAAGLVDVHVRVDHPRQQHLVVGQLDGLGRVDVGVVRRHRGDPAVGHCDRAGDLGAVDDRSSGPDCQVDGGAHALDHG